MAATSTVEHESERAKYMQYFHDGSDDNSGRQHEIATTPLFSLSAKYVDQADESKQHDAPDMVCGTASRADPLPQYGLLGFAADTQPGIQSHEPIMLNTNAPNSVFICGSQGSGKSYTLASMLESLVRPSDTPGKAGNPVAGIVFHYDLDSSGSIAEAAHLASLGLKVDVLVSKSREYKLRKAYTDALKGCSDLTVRPLELRSHDLSVERMNKLMAFAEGEGKVPLYMEMIQQILRKMAVEDKGEQAFSYRAFRSELDAVTVNFTPQQSNPMNLRLRLLESFMVSNPRYNPDKSKLLDLQPGSLTIVDLSDPFVDSATVCVLFDICLSLIKENAPASGLVIALDEAHKYLNDTVAANNFTERLLTSIREQRHNSSRVIIATQEPTLSEKLLDLCSVSVIHRFSSPAWFETIKGHIGGASSLLATADQQKQLMEDIVCLNTGESFVFSPSSYLCVDDGKAKKLASGAVRMKTRLRVGGDGGQSKLASAGKEGEGMENITKGVKATSLWD